MNHVAHTLRKKDGTFIFYAYDDHGPMYLRYENPSPHILAARVALPSDMIQAIKSENGLDDMNTGSSKAVSIPKDTTIVIGREDARQLWTILVDMRWT